MCIFFQSAGYAIEIIPIVSIFHSHLDTFLSVGSNREWEVSYLRLRMSYCLRAKLTVKVKTVSAKPIIVAAACRAKEGDAYSADEVKP